MTSAVHHVHARHILHAVVGSTPRVRPTGVGGAGEQRRRRQECHRPAGHEYAEHHQPAVPVTTGHPVRHMAGHRQRAHVTTVRDVIGETGIGRVKVR